MRPQAIVYTSNTGHTERYAQLLSGRTGLPAYPLKEARQQLDRGEAVLYLGWVCASKVQGYQAAAKAFRVCAVGAVGLSDTGTQLAEIRRATALPAETPLYTLQGGIDRSRLKGMNKLIIAALTRGLAAQKRRTEQEERMLELLGKDASYVCLGNLTALLAWYEKEAADACN